MSTAKAKTAAKKSDVSKKDAAAIAKNKPANPTAVTDEVKPTPKGQDPGPEPVKSPGKPAFCRHSLRPSELFDAKDVVFFREGPSADLKPIPRHEAETRFAAIEKTSSENFDHGKGIGTTVLDLEGGDKVTIAGDKILVTPKEGPASTEGPSLNVHHADVQG